MCLREPLYTARQYCSARCHCRAADGLSPSRVPRDLHVYPAHIRYRRTQQLNVYTLHTHAQYDDSPAHIKYTVISMNGSLRE